MVKDKKRIVVKIGTSILTNAKTFAETNADSLPNSKSTLHSLVNEVAELRLKGHEVLLVTSGAIGAGTKKLGWSHRPNEIPKKQAAAAVGQVTLMQTYRQLFENHKIHVAQLLLTRSDFEDRRRYLNARNTLHTLLELGVVPIINENDTVSVEEIQFGDNDRLSALVASKIDADLLIILTDVDGLWKTSAKPVESGDKHQNELIPLVVKITPDIEKLAWKVSRERVGTGGMASKIDAAKIATTSGVNTIIANGSRERVINDIVEGKNVGTKFISAGSISAKEKWILFGAVPKGEIVIDSGAVHAIRNLHKSLLPAGIVGVKGKFYKGDVVKIKTESDEELARGVVSFSSDQIIGMKGKKSSEIKKILNLSSSATEIIHRNSLVLTP